MLTKVLFLPGLLCNSRLFLAQIEHLQGLGMQCAVGDLSHADNIPALADEVAGRYFQDAQQWHIVALSMGGYVAFELLQRYSGHIARLALLHTSARADTDEQTQTRRSLIQLAQQGRFKGVTPRLLPRLLSPANLNRPEITDVIQTMAGEVGKEAFVRQQQAILSRPDRRAFLPTLRLPTLVIGGRDDTISTPEITMEISNLITDAKLEVLEGSGHLSPLEQGDRVNRLLAEFLVPKTAS